MSKCSMNYSQLILSCEALLMDLSLTRNYYHCKLLETMLLSVVSMSSALFYLALGWFEWCYVV